MITIDSRFKGIEGVEADLLRWEDIEDIVEMLSNPNVCRYLFFAPAPEKVYRDYFTPIVREMEKELSEGKLPRNMVFILREEATGKFIGQCGVMAVPMHEGIFEVGYQLREEYWGQGLATESCKLALNYIFNYLKGHRAEASCYETNMASRRVLEKCGFRHEGYFRGYYKKGDSYIGRANYGLLRGEAGEGVLKEYRNTYTA